jgi:hypothetical protein
MKVCGQLHALAALPPGKEPLVPVEKEAGKDPDSVGNFAEISCSNQVFQPVA